MLLVLGTSLAFGQMQIEGKFEIDSMACLHTERNKVALPESIVYEERDGLVIFHNPDYTEINRIKSVREIEEGVYLYEAYIMENGIPVGESSFIRKGLEYLFTIGEDGDKQWWFFRKLSTKQS